jgi:hypothetical protein
LSTTEQNLDGTITEYSAVDAAQRTLLGVLRDLFARHWREVVFGPCIQGAVFEGRFASRPRLTVLDGYVTVSVAGEAPWHFLRGTLRVGSVVAVRAPGQHRLPARADGAAARPAVRRSPTQ